MRKKLLAMLVLSITLTASVGLAGCFDPVNSSSPDSSSNTESQVSDDSSSDDSESSTDSTDDNSSSGGDSSSTDPVKKTYSVTFNSDGGSAVDTQTVEEGEAVSEPAAPTKGGYTFAGWTLNGEAYDFTAVVSGNIELVAVWTENVVTYTVTFDSDGGSAVEAQTIEADEVATEPTAPTKADYKFGGWFLDGVAYDFSTPVTGNITLTAKWIAGYAVTFNSDGGSAVESQDVNEGGVATKPVAPTKTGYTFAGWTLNGEAYDFTAPIMGDIELIATWTPAEGTAYAFEVYAENLDGSYEYLTKYDKTGTTDSTVTLGNEELALIPNGFEFDAENTNNVLSGTVAADGSLLLKVYIKRAYFNVNYYDYDGTLLYTESVKYEFAANYAEQPTREADSEGIYEFNMWVTEQDGATEADLTSIKSETPVYASYNVQGFSGVYVTAEELLTCSTWGSSNTAVEVSNDVLYNGEASLKITSGSTKMGFGVFLPQDLMNTLLGIENIKGVKLSFDYKVETASNLAYAAIGWEGEGESKNSSRTGDTAFDWQRFETVLTSLPNNFSISFSDNASLAWNQDVSGTVYVANIRYEAVEDLSEGVLIDTDQEDALEYISNETAFGTWSLDSTVKFNGKNTLKYEATTNANAQNFNRLYSIEAVVANLLAQENVIGVRVSTNYMVTANTGMKYIGMTIDTDANTQYISSQTLGAVNVWQSLSGVFTSELDQALLHVSPNKGGAWAASGSGSATVYFSDFTYELIYADEKVAYVGGSSVYKWTGEVGTSSTEQYNGADSITVTDGGAWSMGVFVDNNQLRQLLALPNVTSVNVSFKYKAGTLSSNVHYVGFHGGETVAIDRTDGWHEVSTKLTALPANFIIGAGIASGLEWINATISGTMYIADITFTVNYNEGAIVKASTTQWQDPASVGTSQDYVYGNEENSTKVGFKANYKYANINIQLIKSEGTGYIEFYFKNTTGKALEIYTTQSLAENGGVTSISADTEWQFIRLAIDPTSTTSSICIRGAGESVVSETEIQYVYISSIVEGSANA